MKKIYYYSFALLAAVIVWPSFGQQIRTAYFMNQATMRTEMNPALRPERGFVNIPFIGGINASVMSNSLSLDRVLYPNPDGNGLVTLLDQSVSADQVLGHLKKNNVAEIDASLNLVGFGLYKGKRFWTFGLSAKIAGDARMPKEFFEFAKLGSGLDGRTYDLKDMRVRATSYLEIALGFSQPLRDDRWTLGGKFKLLIGAADGDVYFDHLYLQMDGEAWRANASGRMNIAMNGLKPQLNREEGKEYIDGVDMGFGGPAGYGAAVDFGATFKLLDNLTLSAAVTDLGFISWSAKNTISGIAAGDYTFAGIDLGNGGSGLDAGSFDELLKFEQTASKGHTRMVRSTLNVGAEYAILDNKISFGLLSSTRFSPIRVYSEVTASANFRPLYWLNATLSYSAVHGYNSFGWALNLAPSWINFFIGTDYMFTRITPQCVPIKQKAVNVYFGLGVPLKHKR